MENGLDDTGAQVMMIGLDLAAKLGIRRKDIIDLYVDINEASGGSLEVWGGIPIVLSLHPNYIGNIVKCMQKRRLKGTEANDNWLMNTCSGACRMHKKIKPIGINYNPQAGETY